MESIAAHLGLPGTPASGAAAAGSAPPPPWGGGPHSYLLASPMGMGLGSLVQESVPEDPVQEDLASADDLVAAAEKLLLHGLGRGEGLGSGGGGAAAQPGWLLEAPSAEQQQQQQRRVADSSGVVGELHVRTSRAAASQQLPGPSAGAAEHREHQQLHLDLPPPAEAAAAAAPPPPQRHHLDLHALSSGQHHGSGQAAAGGALAGQWSDPPAPAQPPAAGPASGGVPMRSKRGLPMRASSGSLVGKVSDAGGGGGGGGSGSDSADLIAALVNSIAASAGLGSSAGGGGGGEGLPRLAPRPHRDGSDGKAVGAAVAAQAPAQHAHSTTFGQLVGTVSGGGGGGGAQHGGESSTVLRKLETSPGYPSTGSMALVAGAVMELGPSVSERGSLSPPSSRGRQ